MLIPLDDRASEFGVEVGEAKLDLDSAHAYKRGVVDKNAKGPQIVLTRTSVEFLTKLFGTEVPEIADGVVEIRAVAREPGARSKVAVVSSDDKVDAVGACVGIKGSRVQSIVREMNGERIDIYDRTVWDWEFTADAVVFAVSFGLGSGWGGSFTSYVDMLHIAFAGVETIYNFELEGTSEQ